MKLSFLNNIRRGLGRAYLELRDSDNRIDYLDTLIYACLNDCSYNYVVEGPKSDYLYRMIKLFDDKIQGKMKEIIINSLDYADSTGLLFQKLQLLYEYYLDGDKNIGARLWSFYECFIMKTTRWTKKKLLSFEILAITIDKILGLRKTKKVIQYIESHHLNKDYLGWYCYRLSMMYKKNSYIAEFVKENSQSNSSRYVYTLENLLTTTDRQFISLYVLHASDEEIDKTYEYLKTTKNINHIKNILMSFDDSCTNRRIPDDIYRSLLHQFNGLLDSYIYEAAKHNQSDLILKLGLQLIETKKYLSCGLVMLFNNYSPKYKDVIVRAYKKVNFSFFNDHSCLLTHQTIDFMNHKKKNYPDEILRINYEKSYDSFLRESIYDIMKKRKLLTNDIIYECQYDFDYELSMKSRKQNK